MSQGKRLTAHYIYNVLAKYSDENHPLLQEQIKEYLIKEYDCDIDRKTIHTIINSLIDFDIDIVELPKRKGVYLHERLFDKSQITFLIDAVFSSKSIPGKRAVELTEKLTNTLSIYERISNRRITFSKLELINPVCFPYL